MTSTMAPAPGSPRRQASTVWGRLQSFGILFVFYYTWVLGAAFFVVMWGYSLYCLCLAVTTGSPTAMPLLAQLYLLTMAMYYAYHHVVLQRQQPDWPSVRKYVRRTLSRHPYFRRHLCIFEEREEESIREPCKPLPKANDRAIFAYHPHGMLSAGFALNGALSERFAEADAQWLVAEMLYKFPLLSDILHWLGFGDVSKETFLAHLKEGRNVCLIPGGFEEATIYQRGRHRVFLKHRAGFIKLALQHGYKIYPAYTFGEEETYHSLHHFMKFRLLLNKWKIPGVVFVGRVLFALMPKPDVELITVIGKPVELPLLPHPTREEVGKYHALYVKALVGLFDRYKHKYARDPQATLEIF